MDDCDNIKKSLNYFFTEEDFKSLLGTNNCIQKETGWFVPYPGVDYKGNPMKPVMGYVFLGNLYQDGKNYWIYESLGGCIGNRYTFCGETMDTIGPIKVESSVLKNFPTEFGIKSEKWINNKRLEKLNDIL